MLRRQRPVLAAVGLLILGVSWPPTSASAGFVIYRWSGLVGVGSYYDQFTGSLTDFTTNDGVLTVGYDADNLFASYIDVDTGRAGYEERADNFFEIWTMPTQVSLCATPGSGASIEVTLDGALGPPDADGNPESLAALLGAPAYVTVTPGYHIDLAFAGAAVPEPASLTMLAIGAIGIAVACAGPRRSRSPRRAGDGRRSPVGRHPRPGPVALDRAG
jgi:hypothetical protein